MCVCSTQRVKWKWNAFFLISDTRRMEEENKQSQGDIFTLNFLKPTWPLGTCGGGDLVWSWRAESIAENTRWVLKKMRAFATPTVAASFQEYQSDLPRGEDFVKQCFILSVSTFLGNWQALTCVVCRTLISSNLRSLLQRSTHTEITDFWKKEVVSYRSFVKS